MFELSALSEPCENVIAPLRANSRSAVGVHGAVRGDREAGNLGVWAAEQGTLKDSGNAVALDRLLIGALFNKKEPEVEGDELSLDHTLQRLLKKLQQWSRILCAAPQARPVPRCGHPA